MNIVKPHFEILSRFFRQLFHLHLEEFRFLQVVHKSPDAPEVPAGEAYRQRIALPVQFQELHPEKTGYAGRLALYAVQGIQLFARYADVVLEENPVGRIFVFRLEFHPDLK